MTSLSQLLTERRRRQLCVGTLRELVMAHHAYARSVAEFGRALGVNMDELNDAQTAEVFNQCGAADPREVSDETLINLLKRLEELK